MAQEQRHTATPWVAKGEYVFKGRSCFIVCQTDVFPTSTNEANAAHIALCVNAHDALVDAVRRVFKDEEYFRLSSNTRDAVDAALKLAEGK